MPTIQLDAQAENGDRRDGDRPALRERVRPTLPYIAEHLRGAAPPLSLNAVARVANTAPSHFHRAFRAVTGEPLHRYIRRLRLECAAYRLAFGETPILEVAQDCGYESHAAFTRAFKQFFGCPPSHFRSEPQRAALPCLSEAPPSVSYQGERRVAFIRYFGSYTRIGECWERLGERLARQGEDLRATRPVGIVYDDPEHSVGGSVRYDACVEVDVGFTPRDGLGIQVIPAFHGIAARHRGPQELLVCAYVRLVVDWLLRGKPERFRRLPYYEAYHVFPLPSETAHDVDAEIQVALA